VGLLSESNQRPQGMNMNATESKRLRLRTLLESQETEILVGAHNGLTARLVEEAGFVGVWLGGLEVSASQGLPDRSLLTMTEHMTAADRANLSSGIPVLADCDAGFGSQENVFRLVQEYEKIGIAGVCIEDKRHPKLNSFCEGDQNLETVKNMTEKLDAAMAARLDPNFVVVARVESFIAGLDLCEAMQRAEAYEAVGADAIVVHSKELQPTQIEAFMCSWSSKTPIICIPTTYSETPLRRFRELGVSVVVMANVVIRAMIQSTQQVLKNLRETGCLDSVSEEVCPLSEVFRLQEACFPMRSSGFCSESGQSRRTVPNQGAVRFAEGLK
jgi:phosphoenolpyruvate phosphomutase